MNRSTTLDIEVLQAASKATNANHRHLLVVWLATNANTGGASITTTNVNSQKNLHRLETFVTTTATSTLANLSVTSLTHQIYLDVLGTDLGIRIWEVLEQQKAHIATESTPTEIAPTSPAKEAGNEPPLKEVEVPTTDTLAERETFLERNLGLTYICHAWFYQQLGPTSPSRCTTTKKEINKIPNASTQRDSPVCKDS